MIQGGTMATALITDLQYFHPWLVGLCFIAALQISSLLGQLQNNFYCLISNIFLSPNIWSAHSQLWWTGDFTNKFTILWPLIKDALNWSQPTNGKNENISQQWTESSLIFSPQTIEGNHKAVNLV